MKPANVTTPSTAAVHRPGFRGIVRVSFGPLADLTDDNTDERPRQDLHFVSADQESLRQLKAVLASSFVGVRLVLVGPPADIHAAAAVAAECGLVEEEMRLLGEAEELTVVFCGHCHAATSSTQGPGSEVVCHGCGIPLAISGHFSRRKAAYLGFAAHAEEAA